MLWLASYPKSGNTWVRAFLANYFAGTKEPVPINQLPLYCLGDNFLVHYQQLLGKPTSLISERDIEMSRPKLHHWFASCRGETALVKTHSLFGSLNGQPLITPKATAGFVYIVRNPLDVAASFAHHYQTSIAKAVDSLTEDGKMLPGNEKLLPQVIGSWRQHVESWTSKQIYRHLILRYEDLLSKPNHEFGRLTRFLGLPDDPARRIQAVRNCAFDQLAAQERASGFIEARPCGKVRFFRSGGANNWRRELSCDDAQRIALSAAKQMSAFGYANHIRDAA